MYSITNLKEKGVTFFTADAVCSDVDLMSPAELGVEVTIMMNFELRGVSVFLSCLVNC